MALNTQLKLSGLTLTEPEQRRIQHQLDGLEQRLAHHPEPKATLVLEARSGPRQVEADLRVQLGPLGGHLISHQLAETADRAVHLAIADVERQLERRLATQRGEPSYGVPSRRLPKQERPATYPGPEHEPPEE